MSEWEIVIGLEVHAQLTTQSKIFSGAATAFGAEPNTQACAVDLGLPGVLPVLNQAAVEKAIAFGLAVDAEIAPRSVFARKHYFYPDLPKGYQISQYELPVVGKGKMSIRLEDGSEKVIGITRAHLEEDAGKSIHDLFQDASAIDLNRAGTPLLEIVSEPDMRSASEAVAYLRKLHGLIVSLGICDGNMQEGSFRCDANVSVRKKGAPQFGTRTETKNLNSFKFVEKAINYEVERHIEILESGGKINQETRLFDSIKNETRALRSKEEANDYRYFPDPDLLPLIIHAEDIAKIKATLPELPEAKKARFMAQYQLSDYDAEIISSNLAWTKYYELLATEVSDYKLAANWLMGDLAAALNTHQIDLAQSPIAPADLADLINRIIDNTISGKIAKDIFPLLWNKTGSVDEIIEANGLKQVTDSSAIQAIIDQVIANNPKQLADYRSGKDKLFGFFVGQTMKAMQGKGNPDVINQLLKQSLAA